MINGDEIFALLREKVGEIGFGAAIGWATRMMFAPPESWIEAARTGGLALCAAVVFAEPVAALAGRIPGLESLDLTASAAAAIALAGEKVLKVGFAQLGRYQKDGLKRKGDGE